MEIFDRPKLEEHYAKILEQNRNKILSGGIGDNYLLSPDTDTRMALVLAIRISNPICRNITGYLEELKAVEPNLYYYPASDFHITVLDLLCGMPGRTIPDNIADYIACIKECACQISPFGITFNGATMSDNAVLIKGYYEYALEKFRQLLRQAMKTYNLSLEERYETFSSHITVVRIPEHLTNPDKFLACIADKRPFGEMQVTSFELVFHNWYGSKKQPVATIDIGAAP